MNARWSASHLSERRVVFGVDHRMHAAWSRFCSPLPHRIHGLHAKRAPLAGLLDSTRRCDLPRDPPVYLKQSAFSFFDSWLMSMQILFGISRDPFRASEPHRVTVLPPALLICGQSRAGLRLPRTSSFARTTSATIVKTCRIAEAVPSPREPFARQVHCAAISPVTCVFMTTSSVHTRQG